MIVTVADVRNALHLDEDASEEDYIAGLIQAATSKANNFCRVAFDELDEPPASVIQAIMLMVAHWYQYRDESETGAYEATERAFKSLLWPNRKEELIF